MAVEFLVKAAAKKIFRVGEITTTIKTSPATWGSREQLPSWLIFRVSDADESDIRPYTVQLLERYEVRTEGQNVRILPADKSRIGYKRRTEARNNRTTLSLNDIGFNPVTRENTDEFVIVGAGGLRDLIEAHLNDVAVDFAENRRYLVDPAFVQALVLLGDSVVDLDLATLQANMIDRLDVIRG